MRCCWPALVLQVLACSRLGGDSCAEGLDCTDPGAGEPPSALSQMPAGSAPASDCGDGIRDEGEECDDGSACRDGRDCTEEPARCQVGSGDRSCAPRAGDGCSNVCRMEPGFECPELGGPCQQLPAPPAGSEPPPAASEPPLDVELSPAPAPSGDQGGGPLGAASPGAGQPAAPRPACEVARFDEPQRVQGLEPGLLGLALGGLQLWAPALASDLSTLFFAAAQPGVAERVFMRRVEPGH